MGRRTRVPDKPAEAVEGMLADERIAWFGIKHYSPACAWHVRRLIREVRPDAVLVEGPDDACDWIPWIVHPDTEPPLTLLSSWVDRRNKLGNNGVYSPAPDVPARYRAWWPLVAHGPEYIALCAGHEVGAQLVFVDASLKAQLPVMHGTEQQVSDADLASSAYFRALAARTRRPDFEAFWDATFEAGATSVSTEAFQRAVLTFAWCARNIGAGEEDAHTVLREAHMRWHVDQALKRHAGRIVVVTGAYHTVGLPWLKGKRAAGRPDKDTRTLLSPHSHRALSRLTEQAQLPGWGSAVLEAMDAGSPRPQDDAALELLVATARLARDQGAPVGTADAVGALAVARGLAELRGSAEVTPYELLDAVQTAFVKGDLATEGAPILAAAQRVLVGDRLGRVAEGAGRPPLVEDYAAKCKENRLDLSGAQKVVRCDVHKQPAHRRKSAFLHRCRLIELPMFGDLDGRGPYKGPDLSTGEDLHLSTETWAVQWREVVDDRLVELSDRGTTIAEVAGTILRERLEQAGADVSGVARCLLTAAQARLLTSIPLLLDRLLAGAATDPSVDNLVAALEDVVLLGGYRDALDTRGDARLAEGALALYTSACLKLPGVRHVPDEEAPAAVDRLQSLVRIAVAGALPSGADPDRALLVERLHELVSDATGQPLVRGAATGILFSLGTVTDRAVAAELSSYLDGPLERVLQGGAYLEGVLRSARNAFLTSPRLLRAVHSVLHRLDEQAFRRLLPDLRRAFSVFIPAELDAIGGRVAGELLAGEDTDPDAPIDAATAARARAVDARVSALLEGLGLS